LACRNLYTVSVGSDFPDGDESTYRAKAWLKGTLPDETEERARVVRAINLIGGH
jgi:hypothetical protein